MGFDWLVRAGAVTTLRCTWSMQLDLLRPSYLFSIWGGGYLNGNIRFSRQLWCLFLVIIWIKLLVRLRSLVRRYCVDNLVRADLHVCHIRFAAGEFLFVVEFCLCCCVASRLMVVKYSDQSRTLAVVQ